MKKPAYLYSLRLLSGREYSSAKLKKKLREKKFDEIEIEETLAQLCEERYLCDERYISAKIKQLALRGKSKRYIQHRLIEEGLKITEGDISSILKDAQIDEDDQLRALIQKKYQSLSRTPNTQEKIIEKVLRFALSRGHHFHDIKRILKEEMKTNLEFMQ